MPTASPNSSRKSSLAWGMALAASSLVTIGGGTLMWMHRVPPPTPPAVHSPPPADPVATSGSSAVKPLPPLLPLPPAATVPGIHTVAFGVENGTRVVKIKVVPDGDELIVDAATGRLLETRPNRPTAPPPMGKFAVPFAPMT